MSNSGRMMSMPGWRMYTLLGGVLAVALGAIATATPQDKSKTTTPVPPAAKKTPYSLMDQTGVESSSFETTKRALGTQQHQTNKKARPVEGVRLITKAEARDGALRLVPAPISVPDTEITFGNRTALGTPLNNECAGAMPMTCGSTDSILISDGYTSQGDPIDPTSSCEFDVGGPFGHDASWWYQFTAPAGVTEVTVTMCATADNEDAVSTMFTSASSCAALGELACGEDECDFPNFSPPEYIATVVSGETYLVLVDRYSGGASTDGPYIIEFVCGALCGNDVCDPGEDTCSCPDDCGPETCGNGICCEAEGEACDICVADCGVCPFCGDDNVDPDEDCDPPGSMCPNGLNCLADCVCPVLGGCCVDGACIGDTLEEDCAGNWSANTSCSGAGDLPLPICNTGCSWDNGLPLDDQGAPASQYDAGEPFGAGAADDFILKDSGDNDCLIQHITAWTSHFNGTATPNDYTGVNVTVYGNADPKGPGGQPEDDGTHTGDVIVTVTIPIADITFMQSPTVCNTNIWQLEMDVDFELPKNVKMWLEIQPIMLFGGIGQSAVALSQNSTGHPAQQIFESLGLPWTVIDGNQDECPPDTEQAGTRRDLAFKMIGGKACDGNGICDGIENTCNCVADCGPCEGTCTDGTCCGDNVVEGSEECDFGGCGACPWDADGSLVVGAFDLAILLGNWGLIPGNAAANVVCLDAEPDGIIGAFDLANLLGNWGPCPVGFGGGDNQCSEADCLLNCQCVGRGACCGVKGDPAACDAGLTADECADAGGSYLGDDTLCVDCPHPVCVNAEGDCCADHGTPGCDDPDCCGVVCAIDVVCCDDGWDDICVGLAAVNCDPGCPIPFDDCADRAEIFDGLTPFDTTGATTDGLPVPVGQCNDFGETQVNLDIWFNYIATCDGELLVTTCEEEGGSALYDSDLAMYTANTTDCANIPCPPDNDLLIACNDDDASNLCGTDNFHSTMRNVPVTAGICYKIRVGGWSDQDMNQGPGELFIECTPDTVCGDGLCEGDENRCTCPLDCGNGVCGDGICCAETGEVCDGCVPDCGECSCGISQLPNQVNGLFADTNCAACDTGVHVVADQFLMQLDGSLDLLRWWGGYFPENIPEQPDCFTIIFREDLGGTPGAIINQLGPCAQADTRVATGVVLFGVDEYVYELDLVPNKDLVAGTYWVEIFNNTVLGSEWFWETGDLDPVLGIFGNAFAFEFPEVMWNLEDPPEFDLAFEIQCR